MKVNMNCLCNDVKREIHTFINGNPKTNYKQVVKDVQNYWDLKNNLSLDMEVECDNENCNNVRWSSKMVKIIYTKLGHNVIKEYCSQRCKNQQQLIQRHKRMISFVM